MGTILFVVIYVLGYYFSLTFLFKLERIKYPNISDESNFKRAAILAIIWPCVFTFLLAKYLFRNVNIIDHFK